GHAPGCAYLHRTRLGSELGSESGSNWGQSLVCWKTGCSANFDIPLVRQWWIDGCNRYRQPMGVWPLTWTSGSINGEGPVTEEAAVRVWDQVIRALGLHGAAGVVAIAQVGILTTGFPTVVNPSVLENRGSAWVADI